MRRIFTTALIGYGLLFSGAAASAQVYGRGSYDHGQFSGEFGRYPDDRDSDRGRGRDLFDRVRNDLNRAGSDSDRYGNGADRRRLNKARQELGEFQGKWARGKFDRHELDDVIKSLDHVVRDNSLDSRDYQTLQSDLAQLRDFRARN